MAQDKTLGSKEVRRFVSDLFADDLHAKRVSSLADATLGALHGASLAVSVIGAGLAAAKSLDVRHATKQIDRMLSNPGIDVGLLLPLWVPYVIGNRASIMVAMDWTDFDADDQSTIMLSLFTDHGRATPLVWQTVDKRTLKHQRNAHEYRALIRLAEILPPDVEVCIVADRGFGDRKLYRLLTEDLHFDYIIRFRANIAVTAAEGETRTALDWVAPGGRARLLRGASVTAARYRVGAVACLQDRDMKQAWCLATSYTNKTASELASYYGKRWGIETGFRDTKDLRFGMGMGAIHVSTSERRDRLWLINALAVALLTLLGAAGEALGYDKTLRTSTTKRRTHSLFRQGAMLYELIPTMLERKLRPLMEKYAELMERQPVFQALLGSL
jgi:hypothetical protein